jgi:putative spermidine/putrescine transport system ATP-binding protein
MRNATEPLGALDKNLREQMQIEIRRIHREVGITTIYVTHDQTEAMTMSDRIAVFNQGRLAQVAPPLEVYQRPLSRFVARFIGDGNIFDGIASDPAHGGVDVPGVGRLITPPYDLPRQSHVHVLVRTESVMRLGISASAPPNTLNMAVATTIHYGDSVLVAGTCGQIPVRMRLTGPKHEGLEPGAMLRVGWLPANAHVIPRSPTD